MDRQLARIVIQSMLDSTTPAIADAGYEMFLGLLKLDLLTEVEYPSTYHWRDHILLRRYGKTQYYSWREEGN